MFPIDIRPDKLTQEMLDYSRKLGQGMENLLNAEAIDTGVSPKQAVYSEDKLVLYRYDRPEGAPEAQPVPLLIVYALVNRPYMTDIQEDRSTIKGLLATGQDVYLIDWGYPDQADRALTLDDYINGYIDRCVDYLREAHGVDKVNLLGICQGGAFSLMYSALHPDKVRNLVTMVTPVDFKTPDNLLSAWVQNVDIDLAVDTMGNIPGELLNWTFLSLKPFSLTGQKYVNMVDLLDDPDKVKNFLRMEKWIFDSPDQAGETFRQFIKDFYQNNGFLNGGVVLGGQEVDLKDITCPVLNIFALQDHLVPPDASRALKGLTSSPDYTELAFPGGHIGIYVSGKAQKEVTPAIGKWLNER
ncbi:class III poly(R)-hydroxyalkanoic acid synthase subunit PhaC [Allochromatium vinosum]|uniref:Poly(3-hydroxyalkanoate) polymerase subunit PhaC n=3 Tax=Allochromatium vinosum TaxID=1049 RepID=PHAC_ALLVD|nr:class III poly(R)-hydroxyalkanoic acid synthase subunit PhaC [Allochromatium vinosum]P45370.2 RecName: Full=Poly(3-hydroxyalkanoate) polymerase subunit PhaC; Short=PHA polymerase; AltName: Full=PHB synthase subunit PhaC; AltName: Full=Poly(hydroxyalkanoic acid) synthase subunit PhaC; Short=PHA synthase subunit PhaC; Short=Polyhydroxyalkanoic acid synthase; AltName: Full=Poly-beta-hydroxybutyrate polymerase; Short=PHB polymerase; Short=Poly(3-hydroxybutyrate) polymerase [Allochromatium vinosum D